MIGQLLIYKFKICIISLISTLRFIYLMGVVRGDKGSELHRKILLRRQRKLETELFFCKWRPPQAFTPLGFAPGQCDEIEWTKTTLCATLYLGREGSESHCLTTSRTRKRHSANPSGQHGIEGQKVFAMTSRRLISCWWDVRTFKYTQENFYNKKKWLKMRVPLCIKLEMF